ncbi:unnamed protein product [Urochloa decumbens]|uniref:Uncharacterized protein n=1 Tax=Urochloa decumbens TaxID=240449 RepID=A0ABC9CQE6_9POAL
MEGKTTRAAVLAACLLVLLLSGQPEPVSAMSRYCKCFRKCYTFCRNHDQQPRPVCKVRCGGECIFHREVPAASALAGGDGPCREICLASIGCSTDTATATAGDGGPIDADVAACVDGCTGYYGRLNAKHDGEVDA